MNNKYKQLYSNHLLWHSCKQASFTDKQHVRAYVRPLLVAARCLWPQQQSKHPRTPYFGRQRIATVVLKTTPLCYTARAPPPFFFFFGPWWVLLSERPQPHPAKTTISVHWDTGACKWWLRGTRCHDLRPSPSASGEQWSISSYTLYLRCHWAVTRPVCLGNIWPPVRKGW